MRYIMINKNEYSLFQSVLQREGRYSKPEVVTEAHKLKNSRTRYGKSSTYSKKVEIVMTVFNIHNE